MPYSTRSITPGGNGLNRIIMAAVVLSAGWICGPTAADQAPRTMTIIVPANSADGYVLKGPFKAGTKLAIKYVSGKWTASAGMEEISPDNPSSRSCQTLVAERRKAGDPISILDMVPGGTSVVAKVYQLDCDAGEILIRINGKNGEFSKNSGSVQYRLTIIPVE